MATYDEHQVSGLKQAIGRQANLKKSAEKKLEEMNELFIQSVGAMYEMEVHSDKIEEYIWKYVSINYLWWQGDSHRLNKFSIIRDYTNKKGETFLAHHTENGNYIKRATDDIPISYKGYFHITDATEFEYDLYLREDKWHMPFEPISR